MQTLFLHLLDRSLMIGWVIGIVFLLRFVLHAVPKRYTVLLWLVVLFRLLCPFSPETAVSLVPALLVQPFSAESFAAMQTEPLAQGKAAINNPLDLDGMVLPATIGTDSNVKSPVSTAPRWIFWGSVLWLGGVFLLGGGSVLQWYQIRCRVREAVSDGEAFLCDSISSPFVFGLFRPRMYLPYGLSDEERMYVLLHEKQHIRRGDVWLKPLFWLAVVVYWMHPLVWLAWHFYSKDLELACDECAVQSLDAKEKQSYGHTIVRLAVQPKETLCPVAFGTSPTKERVQHLFSHRPLAFGITVAAVAAIGVSIVFLGVNPISSQPLGSLYPSLEKTETEDAFVEIQYGTTSAILDDEEKIRTIRKQIAALRVIPEGADWAETLRQGKETAVVSAHKILFYGEDKTTPKELIEINDDCTILLPQDRTTETGTFLKVVHPKRLITLLEAYCPTNTAKTEKSKMTTNVSAVADAWAQTFSDRDGVTRYQLMSHTLQKQIDAMGEAEDFPFWMPVWIDPRDHSAGMFLRGSSPWVDSVSVQWNGSAQSATAQVLYDMTDSSQEHYRYQERLQLIPEANGWKVAACDIEVPLMSQEVYDAAKTILEALKHGRETWRLHPEDVAAAFVRDVLGFTDGTFGSWNAKEHTIAYQTKNGVSYTIMLYQPLRSMEEPVYDFWAVQSYAYQEEGQIQQTDISFDLWQSLLVQ